MQGGIRCRLNFYHNLKGSRDMLSLTPRLFACAEAVNGNFACDVGTDHAFLAAYLIQCGKCGHVIASDVADGPLSSAEKTVRELNLEDKISIVKSDGLKNIQKDRITDVIIAGMGGELIFKIISECEWLKSGVSLILQPMTKSEYLRKSLFSSGFEIVSEKAVCENDFIYTVMNVTYSGIRTEISELAQNIGFFDLSFPESRLYFEKQYNKFIKIKNCLELSGRMLEAVPYSVLAENILSVLNGGYRMLVSDIYNELDRIAPFSLTEKGDNCGLITGSMGNSVSRILLALDITNEVVDEAHKKGAELIISHHPVIYNPLFRLNNSSPAVRMAGLNISAICSHSPLDLADGGINDIIYYMLKEPLSLEDCPEILEPVGSDGKGYGRICRSKNAFKSNELAEILKNIFGCTVVRYVSGKQDISRIAFCSGGGKALVPLAIEKNCDAYITGDISHSALIDAKNSGLSLFDCGHFHTETIVLGYLKKLFNAKFPFIITEIAEANKDIAEYI